MSWNDTVGEIKAQLPKFNNRLLHDYREEQVSQFSDFIEEIFKEAVSLPNIELTYEGKTQCSPEQRIMYGMNCAVVPGKMNICNSEVTLWRYNFKYNNEILPLY